jgi:hypothetical protein
MVVSDRTPRPTTQLLVFRFAPETGFAGGLLGAIERIQAGGALRILDGLFVDCDPATGELSALPFGRGGVSAALDFRLDPERRRRISADALSDNPALHEFRNALAEGGAVAAVLVEHRWAQALDLAVERMGGAAAVDDFVEASALDELMPALLESARTVRPVR